MMACFFNGLALLCNSPQGPRQVPGRPLRAAKKQQASQKCGRKWRKARRCGGGGHGVQISDKVGLRNSHFSRSFGLPIENQIETTRVCNKICQCHLCQALVKGFQRIAQHMFQAAGPVDDAGIGGRIETFHQIAARFGEAHHGGEIYGSGWFGQPESTLGTTRGFDKPALR